jgi:hypothetical protein
MSMNVNNVQCRDRKCAKRQSLLSICCLLSALDILNVLRDGEGENIYACAF